MQVIPKLTRHVRGSWCIKTRTHGTVYFGTDEPEARRRYAAWVAAHCCWPTLPPRHCGCTTIICETRCPTRPAATTWARRSDICGTATIARNVTGRVLFYYFF